MMKSMLRVLLAAVLSISILLMSFTVIANDEKIQIIIDGNVLVTDVAPTIIDGRTLVPLRAIFEALGASVEWDEATSTVTAKKESTTIVLKINDKYPTVNGKQQELDVPATVINDRTMVPVRFIANALGTDVAWDESTQTVIITTPTPSLFKDPNLEKAVRNKLNIPTGALKADALQGIDSLEASGLQIISLEGIERLTGLTRLNLSKNNITDVKPLTALLKLSQLDISSNKIAKVKELACLTKLTELKIQYNPLTDVDDIPSFIKSTKIYLLDASYPINITDEASLKEYKAVISKAIEITKLVVTDDMSDLEKELAIHDYLILHTTYETSKNGSIAGSDNCHFAYAALVQGDAIYAGYAKAMDIMLNMVGIDCVTVVGRAYGYLTHAVDHAWNIVKIDGKYYHVDAAFDDRDGSGSDLSHLFFNLSDRQMSVTRNWDRSSHLKCITDSMDYESNLKMNRQVVWKDDNIFLIFSSHLYAVDTNTAETNTMTEDQVVQIQRLGDWIYYINAGDKYKIYRIKTDKTVREKISDVPAIHICIIGNNLYYISKGEAGLYRINSEGDPNSLIKIDTGDFTGNIFGVDNYIVYRAYSKTSGGSFSRVVDGSTNIEKLVDDIPAGFVLKDTTVEVGYGICESISNGYLYYISTISANALCRVKLDGTDYKQLSRDGVNSLKFEIAGDYIYYKNSSDGNKNYRIKTDGSIRACIEK